MNRHGAAQCVTDKAAVTFPRAPKTLRRTVTRRPSSANRRYVGMIYHRHAAKQLMSQGRNCVTDNQRYPINNYKNRTVIAIATAVSNSQINLDKCVITTQYETQFAKRKNVIRIYYALMPKNDHSNIIPLQSKRMQYRRIESLNAITAYRNVHGALIAINLIKLIMPIIVCRLIVETRS